MDSQLPACDLIDKIFDMEPAHSSEIGGNAWLDRNTGLLFDLSKDTHEGIDTLWRFKVTHPARLPDYRLVLMTFHRTEETSRSVEHAAYIISLTWFFSRLDERPNPIFVKNLERVSVSPDFGGIDPKYHDHFLEILHANKRGLVHYPIRDEIIEKLGGRQRFLDICLKAIKACHCKYTAIPGKEPFMRQRAKEVTFELVN